jgi:hypothetical protein
LTGCIKKQWKVDGLNLNNNIFLNFIKNHDALEFYLNNFEIPDEEKIFIEIFYKHVLEFKKVEPAKKTKNLTEKMLKTAAHTALKQIKEKRYTETLRKHHLERGLLIGVAFSGKHVSVVQETCVFLDL